MGEEDDTKAKGSAFHDASGGLDKNARLPSDEDSVDASGGLDKNARLSRDEDSVGAAKTDINSDLLSYEPDDQIYNKRRSADSDDLDPELSELIAADLFDPSCSHTGEFQGIDYPYETQQNTATLTSDNEESTAPPTKRSKTSRGKGKKVTANAAAEVFASARGSWIAPQVHEGKAPISSTTAPHLSQEYILHHRHLRHDQSARGDKRFVLPEKAQAQPKSCPAGDRDSILLQG